MTIGTSIPLLSTPARAEQAAFRGLLDCMARPGTVRQLAAHVRPEDGEWCTALLVAQTLIDHEVTFASLTDDSVADLAVTSRTGSRMVAIGEADFVIAHSDRAAEAIRNARDGSIEEPELSATVIIACLHIGSGPVVLELSGPGVPGTRELRVDGVAVDSFRALAERNARFPDGIDVVLAAQDGALACLPRSTSIRVIE